MRRAIKLSGFVAIFLGLTGIIQADEAKGTIKTVNTGRKEVVLKGVVSDTVYELNKSATVWLDGARCKLADLTADDRAVVVFEKRGDHYMASSVRGLRRAQETTGTIGEVIGEKREITLKGIVKNTTYEMNKTATIWINNKKAALTDIRQGDRVLVTYETRGEHLMANDVTVLNRSK